MKTILAAALLLIASPAWAGPEMLLTVWGGGSYQTTINDISSLQSNITADTGTESVLMRAGTITANTVCSGYDGDINTITLTVDGVVRDQVICDGPFDGVDVPDQLSYAVTAGIHTARINTTAIGGNLQYVSNIKIPVPSTAPSTWPSSAAINAITALSSTGTTDTDTQAGLTAAGNLSVTGSCSSFDVGQVAAVIVVVDGVSHNIVYCENGTSFTDTYIEPLVAGYHSIRVYGTTSQTSDTFSAGPFSIPVP